MELLPVLGMAWPTSIGAQTLRPEAQRNIPCHWIVYLFHRFSCIKNVTHIILVMQNHSKWQKVNGSCQDYWRVIVAVSWHIKCERFYLIIVQWSGWEVNIKCKTNAMQKECKALFCFGLVFFLTWWVCCSCSFSHFESLYCHSRCFISSISDYVYLAVLKSLKVWVGYIIISFFYNLQKIFSIIILM